MASKRRALALRAPKLSVGLLHVNDAFRRELLCTLDRGLLRFHNGARPLSVRQLNCPTLWVWLDEILTVLCHIPLQQMFQQPYGGRARHQQQLIGSDAPPPRRELAQWHCDR